MCPTPSEIVQYKRRLQKIQLFTKYQQWEIRRIEEITATIIGTYSAEEKESSSKRVILY